MCGIDIQFFRNFGGYLVIIEAVAQFDIQCHTGTGETSGMRKEFYQFLMYQVIIEFPGIGDEIG